MSEEEIKEITFVDVEKGKISSFFKKRMEQKGIQLNPEASSGIRASDFISFASTPSTPSKPSSLSKPSHTHTHIHTNMESGNQNDIRKMVAKMLDGYEEIMDDEALNAVPTGARIKYITYDPEKKIELFRPGGYMRGVKPNCVILAGLYRNVYNKRYRVNRRIYDPKNKSQLLYLTRFFVKADPKAHGSTFLGDRRSPEGCRESSTQVHQMIPTFMMEGGGESRESQESQESRDMSEGGQSSSSFERTCERILNEKNRELERLTQRVNQLRELDQRRESFRIKKWSTQKIYPENIPRKIISW